MQSYKSVYFSDLSFNLHSDACFNACINQKNSHIGNIIEFLIYQYDKNNRYIHNRLSIMTILSQIVVVTGHACGMDSALPTH